MALTFIMKHISVVCFYYKYEIRKIEIKRDWQAQG